MIEAERESFASLGQSRDVPVDCAFECLSELLLVSEGIAGPRAHMQLASVEGGHANLDIVECGSIRVIVWHKAKHVLFSKISSNLFANVNHRLPRLR